jgi:hypothetical protein
MKNCKQNTTFIQIGKNICHFNADVSAIFVTNGIVTNKLCPAVRTVEEV